MIKKLHTLICLRNFIFAICMLLGIPLAAQKTLIVGINYGYNIPAGDLDDRFGSYFHSGFDFNFQTGQWFLMLENNFLFGSESKIDVLSNLRTEEGYIIDGENLLDIGTNLGGLRSVLSIGRLIHLGKEESGWSFTTGLGCGLYRRKIRFTRDGSQLTQLRNPYLKGYDQLSGGLELQESLGLLYLSTNRMINFHLRFLIMQGFVRDLRKTHYNPNLTVPANQFDLNFGWQLTWILPFYLEDL